MNKLFTFIAGLSVTAGAMAAPLPIPVNPVVESYSRRGYMYELKVEILPQSTEGKPLSADNLYYRFYVNGEPFTFTTSDYRYIESDMTLIPWNYQDDNGNGYDIMKWWDNDNLRRIYFYNSYDEIGIETIYKSGAEESVSALYTYNTVTGVGVVGEIPDPGPEPDYGQVITELPDGARSSLYLLDTWLLSGFGLQHYTWSGKYDYVSSLGDEVYILDICGMYRFGTYVKGTLLEKGSILRVEMGQQVFHQAEDPDTGTEQADVYLYALSLNEPGDDVEILLDREYVDFSVDENGVITLPDNLGLAYVGQDGHVLAKNLGYTFEPFDIETATVTPPADSVALPYKLTYSNEPDAKPNTRGGVNLVADDATATIYVQGLAKTMTEGWIKGTLDGDKVVFESRQFLGTYVNDNQDQFAVFFNGAEATDEMGVFGRVYKTLPDVTFAYDKENETLKTDKCVTETIGDINPLSHMVTPELIPDKSDDFRPATPANSTILSWRRFGFVYELMVDVPSVDTEGDLLDVNCLWYRLYLDGLEEPFVFDTDTYHYIENDMVEIPWDYQDQDGIGYDITKWTDEDTRRIFFYDQPKVIAIESVYTIDDKTRVSQRYYYDIENGVGSYENPLLFTGTHSIGSEVRVFYTTLDGQHLENPGPGVCMKTVQYPDGVRKTTKIMIL